MRTRAKEIHRSRKREEERLREKIKSLRTVKPVSSARSSVRGGSRPTAAKSPAAPRTARPKPAAATEGRPND